MKTTALGLGMFLSAAAAFAAPPSGFEGRVEALRKQIGVPGLGLAIVENDKVTLAKGFGVKRLGAPDPVDADTIFPTGSTGKAFTVAALGITAGYESLRGATIDSGQLMALAPLIARSLGITVTD